MFSLRLAFSKRSQSPSKTTRCLLEKPRFYRPMLEALEDRIAPATRVWTGAADGLWSNASNWSGGVGPVNGDTVVFGSGAANLANNDDIASLTLQSIVFSAGGYLIGGIGGNTITLGSGGIVNKSGTNAITGSVDIVAQSSTANLLVTSYSGAVLTLASPLFGSTTSGELIKSGSGTVSLINNINNSIGNTLVRQGKLSIFNSSALSTGTVIVNGNGTLDLHNVLMSNSLILAGSATTGAAVVAAAGSSTWLGSITLMGTNRFDEPVSSDNLIVDGIIGGSGPLQKTGAGRLSLLGNNTYTGATTVSAGILNFSTNSSALGSTAVGTTVAAGATLEIAGTTTTFEPLTLNSGSTFESLSGNNILSGALVLAGGTATFQVDGDQLTVTGVVSGTGGLTKTGPGNLELTHANTYTGVTSIQDGILGIQSATALGTTAGRTTVLAGASLWDEVATAVAEPLTLNGDGFDETGALFASGNATWSGAITLADSSAIGVALSQVFQLTGVISGPAIDDLAFVGPGTVMVKGINTYLGGTTVEGTLDVENASGLGSVSNGTTVVHGGILEIGALTVAEPLFLDATAILKNISGVSTVSGTVTLFGPNSSAQFQSSGTELKISGAISDLGNGGFAVTAGTVRLTGTSNNVAQATVTLSSKLIVDGSLVSVGQVTAISASTLSGKGTISAPKVIAPFFDCGLSPSRAGLTINGAVISQFDVFNANLGLNGAVAGADHLVLTGSTTIDLSTMTLNLGIDAGFTPALNASFTLIDNQTAFAIGSTFVGLGEGATFVVGGKTFKISYVGGTGNDVTVKRIA